MSALTKFVAVTSGLLTSALVSLHLKFGVRLRNVRFACDDLKKTENNNNIALPSKFSILSQNIWCSFICGGADRRKRLKLLMENISEGNPDIICLQEMFIFALGPFLICGDFEYLHNELVNTFGYKYYSDAKQTLPKLFGGNNGLMVYSKYKLDCCESYAFNTDIRRLFSAKGWISVNINEYMIINTHLEHAKRDYKLKQLDVLCKQLDVNQKYKICLGDFNICSRHTFEEEYEDGYKLYDILHTAMNEKGLKYDLFKSAERTFRITEKEPNSCYDHIFVDENVKNMVVGTYIMDYRQPKSDLVVSDHYGLRIDIDQTTVSVPKNL